MAEHDSDPSHNAVDDSERWIIPNAAHMEAMAEFAAGAGHEINNPLATIIGRAQQLLRDETNPQRRQMLQSIGAQAYRIRDMIGDTMLFGRPPKPEPQLAQLRPIVERVVSQLGPSNCDISCTIPSDLTLTADPTQLAIVLSEFLRNSRQALQPDGGTIQLRAKAQSGNVRIEVEDRGTGFSDVERIHAFDPFFSGRQAGRGLGFGLPKCWQILKQHGGRIEIESPPGGPTIVRSYWPAT